jgi:hypothetical protein
VQTDLGARAHLVAYVYARSRVVSDDDRGKAGSYAGATKRCDTLLEIGENALRYRCAVEY